MVFRYVTFFTCVVWVFTIATEMVSLLTALGVFWNIDGTVVGLTFLAWANSIPDFVANVSLTRGGKVRTAVGGVMRVVLRAVI